MTPPQSCQAIKNKINLENSQSQQESKEVGQVNAVWYSGWDLEQNKDMR